MDVALIALLVVLIVPSLFLACCLVGLALVTALGQLSVGRVAHRRRHEAARR